MASTSIKTRIKINSPNINVLEFDNDHPLPALWEGGGGGPIIVPGPGGPADLPEVFDKVMNSCEGFCRSFIRMYDNLKTDGCKDLVQEITEVGKKAVIPIVVTGIIEEYSDAGRTIDALVVYLTLLVSKCAPNV